MDDPKQKCMQTEARILLLANLIHSPLIGGATGAIKYQNNKTYTEHSNIDILKSVNVYQFKCREEWESTKTYAIINSKQNRHENKQTSECYCARDNS